MLNYGLGRKIDKVLEYKIGVKWRWLFPGDILSILDLRHTNRAVNSDFFKFKNTNYAIISKNDIGATVGNILDIIYRMLSRKERNFVFNR